MKIIKYTVSFFTWLLFICFSVNCSKAQGKGFGLSINGQLSHFNGKFDPVAWDVTHRYEYPVDPGIEIFLLLKLNSGFSFKSGVALWHGRFTTVSSIKNYSGEFKAIFNEFALPLMIQKEFGHNYFFAGGFYTGWLSKFKFFAYDYGEAEWYDALAPEMEKKFLIDFCIEIGKYQMAFTRKELLLVPFFKYKIRDNWIGDFRSRINYGIKIGYKFNL